ncbi:hypothetical protein BT96DRAFT_945545 [Gymnopus androsaceus JB14]|uniref:Uncharacterized protein n=1 Tax=Gymnopus androsaceus JB14 TaxID=1447944 RepID=A0A6A4GZH4_9AGAR|nr:hypothetical protein BT96DRAFT_945545 [Gymnopus androsaceus JB14]
MRLENVPNSIVNEEFEALGFDMPVTEHRPSRRPRPSFGQQQQRVGRMRTKGLMKTKDKMRKSMKAQYKDFRTRRDRTDKTWMNFETQLDKIMLAYMDWDSVEKHQPESRRVPKELMDLNIVDIFAYSFVVQSSESSLFVKALCDAEGSPFKPYLATQMLLAVMAPTGACSTAAHLASIELEGEEKLPVSPVRLMHGTRKTGSLLMSLSLRTGPLSPERHLWAEGQCEDRWHNAKDKNTAHSVGKFLECGWFAFLYMIRSGEQSKYSLSVLNCYMAVEQEERKVTKEGRPEGALAIAYNIHCKFSKTVKQSPLKNLAEWCNYLPVIGTMHGYAHERAFGTGIEDGETLTTFETYSKSSLFIYNNYKQALSLLKARHTVAKAMRESGIEAAETFYEWLVEEGEYLCSLSKVPPEETLEMEYFLKLEALYGCIKDLKEAWLTWQSYKPDGGRDQGPALERRCWNEMENERSEKWNAAKKTVKEAAYQKALDKLESLLVARMFEMTRLNVAGTGYSGSEMATQKNRMLMQEFFKLIRAENELPRLHVEIRQFFTYMSDEEQRLKAIAKDLEELDPALALQVILHWKEHGRFNDIHRQRLLSIKRLDGFDFSNNKYFWPGVAVAKEALLQHFNSPSFNDNPGGDVEEEDDDIEVIYISSLCCNKRPWECLWCSGGS